MTSPPPRLIGRDRLAAKLREIRARKGRSVRAFAKASGIASSKVSRVETGQQIPELSELQAWLSVDPGDASHLLEFQQLRDDALTERSLNRRRFKDGQAVVQDEFTKLTASAKLIRTFQPAAIPSYLQTPEYARAMLSTTPLLFDDTGDIEEAVAARMRRGELLKDATRRFELLMWQPALKRSVGGPAVMRRQLSHIGAFVGLDHIRIGVIPEGAPATVPIGSPFVLYDDVAVVESIVDDPAYSGQDAAVLGRYLDILWEEAKEGDEAGELILRAAQDLAN